MSLKPHQLINQINSMKNGLPSFRGANTRFFSETENSKVNF